MGQPSLPTTNVENQCFLFSRDAIPNPGLASEASPLVPSRCPPVCPTSKRCVALTSFVGPPQHGVGPPPWHRPRLIDTTHGGGVLYGAPVIGIHSVKYSQSLVVACNTNFYLVLYFFQV